MEVLYFKAFSDTPDYPFKRAHCFFGNFEETLEFSIKLMKFAKHLEAHNLIKKISLILFESNMYSYYKF